MTDQIITIFARIIEAGGYPVVSGLMVLESMIAPVPSEAVMPFAGFLIASGQMSFAKIIFFSTLGSIIGSLLSYAIGFYGGRPLVRRWGRYLLLNEHHLVMTERFFERFGTKTIFFSRFIPIVRHLISLPAGTGRMPLVKFTIYTILGAGLWNAFLTYLGYLLGSNWTVIRKYSEAIDIVLLIVIAATIIYLLRRRRHKRLATLNDQKEVKTT